MAVVSFIATSISTTTYTKHCYFIWDVVSKKKVH
jgi:hypothetical protein